MRRPNNRIAGGVVGFPMIIALGMLVANTTFAAESNHPRLRFHKPTKDWLEGLPLGNGISAAMLYGQPSKTIVSLNHIDFWRDHLGKEISDYSAHVKEARRLMLEGKAKEANDYYYKHVNMRVAPNSKRGFPGGSFCGYTNSFQPIGNVLIELDAQDPVTDYSRELDLENGIAVASYKLLGKLVRQECFIPAEEDVVIVRITSETPIAGRISFDPAAWEEYKWAATVDGDSIGVQGAFIDGVKSALLVKVQTSDGRIKAEGKSLRVEEAKEILLLIAVDAGKGQHDPAKVANDKIASAMKKNADSIRQSHCKEHAAMFNRVELSLGKPAETPAATDVLVSRAVKGEYDSELAELVFQMGRYLMMSCNRAGRRPANLQGIWNNHISPEWDSDWHFDMNIEMNHWLCNSVNLDECHVALFNQTDRFVEPGKMNARNVAGTDGILFYGIGGGDGMMWTSQGGIWTGAAGWIAQHYWRHYEFTQDREFLAKRAYPFLKQVGLFYRGWVAKDAAGKYVTVLSHSPENVPPNGQVNNIHCTMDTAIVREVMRHLLEAGKILDADRDLWPVWQDLHDNVLPYPVSDQGVLKEWPPPLEEQPAHRHFSHLYPLFPGDEYTAEETPQLFEAARKAVLLRESQGRAHNFGWSYPYLACLYARLGMGDLALENLHCLAKAVTVDNLLTCGTDWRGQQLTGEWLFNVPRLFQIEAGLGATAAVSEMLLQSHRGVIRLLPALPAKWSTGRYKGLKARGAFEVSCTWRNGSVIEAEICSLKGLPCRVHNMRPWKSVKVVSGTNNVTYSCDANGVLGFDTEAGKTYRLAFGG